MADPEPQPPCEVCGSLPESYLAQTGYGDSLPDAASKLICLEIDHYRGVRRCPACDTYFDWEDIPQHYGSGNLDEERLDRLKPTQATLIRALLALDFSSLPAAELAPRASQELPEGLYHALLRHLCYQAAFTPLVLPLATLLATTNDQGLVGVLLSWADKKRERLTLLADHLAAFDRPLSRFGQVLLDLARERLAALSA